MTLNVAFRTSQYYWNIERRDQRISRILQSYINQTNIFKELDNNSSVDSLPYGVSVTTRSSNKCTALTIYFVGVEWGSEAHRHMLYLVRQYILPDVELVTELCRGHMQHE